MQKALLRKAHQWNAQLVTILQGLKIHCQGFSTLINGAVDWCVVSIGICFPARQFTFSQSIWPTSPEDLFFGSASSQRELHSSMEHTHTTMQCCQCFRCLTFQSYSIFVFTMCSFYFPSFNVLVHFHFFILNCILCILVLSVVQEHILLSQFVICVMLKICIYII